MKRYFYIVALILTVISATSFSSCNNKAEVTLSDKVDTLSYVQGIILGENLSQQLNYDPKINKDEFLKGFKSGLNADSSQYSFIAGQSVGLNISNNMERDIYVLGVMMNKEILYNAFYSIIKEDSVLFKDEDINQIANRIFEELLEKKKEQEMARLAEAPEAKENLAKGEAWLAEKEKEEGVIKTESGLLYKVIKEGTGKRPSATDKITCNYKGSLIDGTVFESSYNRNKPAEFALNGVIKGWSEALQLMNEGAKYEIYIPANLGYGALTNGSIPANSVLIFELELISVK